MQQMNIEPSRDKLLLMPTANKTPRPRCERCLRPASHCVCAHVPSICNSMRVLVLQHPDEARHPLNTARLAVLGLQNAQLLVGESFPELNDMIASVEQALLLFPGKGLGAPVPLTGKQAGTCSLLIVPDGTWRKARRIMQANPVLDTLPRLSLPEGEPSQYRVRKASETAAVSTIEAIVRALSILEPEHDFQPLLKPFNAMVEQQIEAMGEGVYRRNHATDTEAGRVSNN